MNERSTLCHAVQHNCHVADAAFARNYSMCTYLLKMREFYRWEQRANLTADLCRATIGDWIEQRELLWDALDTEDYRCIPVDTGCHDPFAIRDINSRLVPAGTVYAGGIGLFGQPQFFLGELLTSEQRGELTVYVSGKEYARDLTAPPAMMLDGIIYVRRESLRRMVWEMLEEWRWRRPPGPMAWIAAHYRLDEDAETAAERIAEHEIDSLTNHEAGEWAVEQSFGASWRAVLQDAMSSPTELRVRAIRDLLADCTAVLPELVAQQNAPSLHFYFANLSGLRKQIFPSAVAAYRSWVDNDSLAPLRTLLPTAGEHWHRIVTTIVQRHREDPANLATVVDTLIRGEAIL